MPPGWRGHEGWNGSGMAVKGDFDHLNDLLLEKDWEENEKKNKVSTLVDELYLYLYIFPNMSGNHFFLRMVLIVLLLHPPCKEINFIIPEEISCKKVHVKK